MLTEFNCTFHHIGIACRDLDAEQAGWAALGYAQEGPEFQDPIQRVRGRFLTGPGLRLELLAPTAENSPVEGVIKRRTKLYHQAFVTPMFGRALEAIEARGARRTAEPAPAIAFGGRHIVFVLLFNGHVIELIEA